MGFKKVVKQSLNNFNQKLLLVTKDVQCILIIQWY